LVLYSADLHHTLGFYNKLGIAFIRHRHGSGPEHLSTENTPAALFLAACAESASNNPHRRGPRILAKWLLDQTNT
jgi:hypothetical protein